MKTKKSGVYVKLHSSAGKELLAVADINLVGKKFEEKEICIDVNERFYKGEEKTEEEVMEDMKKAANVNMVGKKAVSLGIKAKIIAEDCVIKIKNIPHAISIKYGI